MLNEPASTLTDRLPQPIAAAPAVLPDARLEAIRAAVMQVMTVEVEHRPDSPPAASGMASMVTPDPAYLIHFEGRLTVESEAAFALLDRVCAPLDFTPALRESGGRQHIHVVDGRERPQPRRWIWNAVLFVVTFFSVLYVGATIYLADFIYDLPPLGARLFQMDFNAHPLKYIHHGLPYALAILSILGAHEMGHYFAARRRGVAVTLPYFLPLPFGLTGTLGAFIQLREPIKNRRTLLEVGAAGPLAGLVFAVPILFLGLATSRTAPIASGLLEGDSLFYAMAKLLVFGEWMPNAQTDVLLNQLAWAGWTGLLITGLNLMPIGQLDGGHVIYALIGDRARHIYLPAILMLALLTILTDGALILMLMLLILFGRAHAVPLDDITPLDAPRRWVALVTLVIFVLVFVPVPLAYREVTPVLLHPEALMAPVMFGLLRRR